MNCKKIILGFALGLACLSVQNAPAAPLIKGKKTDAQAVKPHVFWTDAYGRVTYTINTMTSPVVKVALQMFSDDMKAVTGTEAKAKSGSNLQIYQLDMLTKKEFATVEKLGIPLHKIIAAKDAYYIGTRKNKVVVVGSNSRGTAYAIMHLSEMAGVSPWASWNDLKPQPRRSLYTPTGKEWIEIPRIEFRGLALNNSQWMKPQNYSRIARQMLRLKANTLWQVDGKHEAAYNKAVVDSFDICVAENYRVTEPLGKKHKKHKKNIENVRLLLDDPQIDISSITPGLMLEMLNSDDFVESKSVHHDKSHRSTHHNNEDCAWIANVGNLKFAEPQLSMMMDLAWNKNALKMGPKAYMQNWFSSLFGDATSKRIQPLLEEYYRLSNIRQPRYMAMPYGDTEFHSGEFGNELERYLYAYDQLKTKAEYLEHSLPATQKDGYFELVKYPIFSAALIAEKELEAQEARYIARPGLFNTDDEAKAAAAVSLSAYSTLQQLDRYYGNLRKGKWRDFVDAQAAEKQAPQLPGTLSAADIKRYKKEAFDRTADLQPLSISTNDIVAKNAYEWSRATESPQAQASVQGAERISLCPFIGHSNKAVKLPKNAGLSYRFNIEKSGDARFTLAVVPNYSMKSRSMRVSVSIDHADPVVCQMNEAYNSKQWKIDLWRGQALKSFYVTLPSGNHTIEIKALDDNILLDQWVLDYDVDREYYVFPVAK